MAVIALLTAPLMAVVPPQAASGAQADGPLRVVGELPAPVPAKDKDRAGTVVHVDAASRRLFYVYPDIDLVLRVATYDMRTRIPRQIGGGVLGPEISYPIVTSYTVAFDSKRNRLTFIQGSVDETGQPLSVGVPTITVYDVTAHKVVAKWKVAQRLPGFYPMGLTYSRADDRYYVVGEATAQLYITDGTVIGGGKAVGPGSTVVSLEPAGGDVEWARTIAECQQILFSKGIGSNVARSTIRDALYFMCVSGGSPAGQTYPGQAGLVRLAIKPGGNSADAAQGAVEFFAISGNYYAGGRGSGITAFDPTTERFYVQSISFRTPGSWVFDGRLTAWVGFVSSPSNANYFIGINEGLGHLYIGTKRGGSVEATDGIVVADVRQTPVPAGEFEPLVPTSLIPTDSKSNRLFIRPVDVKEPYLVVEDTTPVTRRTTPENYDLETKDLPDTPDVDVFYGIGATGYGAQAVQVGGTGAPGTALGFPPPNIPGIPNVADGTRALMTSRVGGLDLREGGAAASAQSALPDLNTHQEYEAQDLDNDGVNEKWPYPSGTCLDAGNRPVKKTWRDETNRSSGVWAIECDLAKNVARATVRMGASGAGGAAVKKSGYDAVATRDRKNGAVVSTSTFADGTALELLGGYVVSYGRVEATSKSVAHGRPGTTYALYTRSVEGVRVVGPGGGTVFAAPGCASRVEMTGGKKPVVTDSCTQLADAINKVLPTRLKVQFPMPNVEATPKGAFAGVEQTDGQYFQQVVVNDQGVIYRGDSVGLRPVPAMVSETYNDTTERSRTVTVLAATQSNAVFQVSPEYDWGSDDDDDTGNGGGDDGGDTGPGNNNGSGDPGITPGGTANGPGGTTGGTQPPVATGPGTVAIPIANLRGFLFLRRSLKDTALLVLVAGLALGGAGTMWRRRRLVEVLVTVPRKESAL